MTAANTQETKALRENEKKWGKEPVALGWTLVPNIILSKQHALGLDPVDINIILQIAKHWWRAGEAPFPSQIQLAKSMNVDLSTVKRHLTRLRKDRLIDWTARHGKDGERRSNSYDLSGLIAKLREFAVEESAARKLDADHRKARGLRRRPGRGNLQIVRGKGVADD